MNTSRHADPPSKANPQDLLADSFPTTAGKISGPLHDRGVISRFRQYLPVTDATPVVSLSEGSTPLILAERLSDKLQIMMVPADGKFFMNDVLRSMNMGSAAGTAAPAEQAEEQR